ncbi:DUF3135 domain-containing protein [Endothiovibrio diazotrophicus]
MTRNAADEALAHDDFIEHFDWWMRLAAEQPERFDEAWRELVRGMIEGAPSRCRRGLEGTQFRADMERRRARSPMGACVRLSRLMWDRLVGEEGLQEKMIELNRHLSPGGRAAIRDPEHPPAALRSAQVVPFRIRLP